MSINKHDKLLIEKFLKKVPIFKNFSDSRLKQIIEDFKILFIDKDETIVFQSEESTDLYIVLTGKVRITFMNTDGDELILTTFGEGDFFGEMSLIDGEPRSATVVAEEGTSLGVLKRGKFLKAIKQDPAIAIDLLTALVKRLRKADEMIESLAFLDVRERLIKFLAHTAKKEGEKDEEGFYRLKKRTHKELAASIGASREAVSKVLKALAFKQVVLEEDGYFLISPEVYEDADKIL